MWCSLLLHTSFWIFSLEKQICHETFYMSNSRDVIRAISEGLNIRTALRAHPSSSRLSAAYSWFSWGLTVGREVCPSPPPHLGRSLSVHMDAQQAAHQLPSQDVAKPVTRCRSFMLKHVVPGIKQGSIAYSVQQDQKLTVTLQVR